MQRLSLFVLIGWTFIFWIVLINITVSLGLFGSSNIQFDNSQTVNDSIKKAIDLLSYKVLGAAIGAGVVTALFGLLQRVRRNEKRLIADSLIMIVFCLVSVIMAQMMVRSFLMSANI